MYQWRDMNEEQRAEWLKQGRLAGIRLHEPHHPEIDGQTYLLSAACFDHQAILASVERRMNFEQELLDAVLQIPHATVYGWCILPNHYHLLAQCDLKIFSRAVGRLHNGTSTRWNREDQSVGRRVWFRFSDRGVRSERHFKTALNYIHANPVKHGYARLAHQWPCSSVHHYLESQGRESLQLLWRSYPVRDFGKGWDW